MFSNLDPTDLFVKCKFKKTQLDAMRQIYYKYFAQYMIKPYTGLAMVAIWEENETWPFGNGFVDKECRLDPLWTEFADLLPYMSQHGAITKIPPGSTMLPHIDREFRPESIYFPIEGCSELCISEYYDLPKIRTKNRIGINDHPPALYSYSITDNAYLTNIHEWHGVRNLSSVERIAIGWNFKNTSMTYIDCRRVLLDLGYLE